MGWADQFIKVLNDKGQVIFNPKGNSMQPKIESGDEVTVKAINAMKFKVGDIVLCKVQGKQYLHLISAIDEYNDRYQISNNKNYQNGWIGASAIYGICVKIKDKEILTETDLSLRLN